MYGAILGDIIGSRFEFDRGGKTKDFELFNVDDGFTDDTVMTVAIAEALLSVGKDAGIDEIHSAVIKAMKKWGRKYPNAGFGGRFYNWLFYLDDPKPYNSWGNGSAMRVSPVGWLYDSLERTREVARATAEVTHNHPEGIKGAECTAAVMYLARTGKSKKEIKDYVQSEFDYNLSESLDAMRKRHKHDESCMDSLPKALVSFFEGESYEDVVRNAVSLGGDTDTLAAIAGAMAEAFYSIPLSLIAEGSGFLSSDISDVIKRFNIAVGRSEVVTESAYINNRYIKAAVENYHENNRWDNVVDILGVLIKRIEEGGEAPAPMIDVNNVSEGFNLDEIKAGDIIQLEQEMRLKFDVLKDEDDGSLWMPLYTDYDEIIQGKATNITINAPIKVILDNAYKSDRLKGLVINPFGKMIKLPKEVLSIVFKYLEG